MSDNLFQRQSYPNLFQPNTSQNGWGIQTKTEPPVKGSYRAPFALTKGFRGDFQGVFTTLIDQQQYQGYSLIMVRLEDYYLIRTQQITQMHKDSICKSIQENKFNKKLIESNNIDLKWPNFISQNDPFGKSNTQIQSANIFQTNSNQNSSFPFTSSLNTNSNNAFSSTNNNNINSNNSNNCFKSPQNTNIFGQQQQQQQKNITNINTNNNQDNMFNNNNFFKQTPQLHQTPQFEQQQNSWIQPQLQQQQQQQQQVNIFQQQKSQQQIMPPQLQLEQNPINTDISQSFQQQVLQLPQMQQQMCQFPNCYQLPMQPQTIIQSQNNTVPLNYLQWHLVQIENATNALNQQLLEMEKFKKLEDEKYKEQEIILNQIEKKQFMERQKREKELNKSYCQKPYKQNSNTHINTKVNQSFLKQSQMQISRTFIKESKTINYCIDCYFEESEKVISFEEHFQENIRREYIKEQILKKLWSQQIFKNDNGYMFNSQIEIDENINQTQQPTISLKIYSTYRPILTKSGYETIPDITQLKINQLKNVKEFTVYNEYGSIKWNTPTNLLYLNLDKLIEITKEKIDVYNLEIIHDYMKPDVNIKLNKPCFLTLKVSVPFTENTLQQRIIGLQEQCKKQNIQFISASLEDQTFTVKVEHFSKYEFTHDDDDEEEVDETQQQNLNNNNVFTEQQQQLPIIHNLNQQQQGKQKEEEEEAEETLNHFENLKEQFFYDLKEIESPQKKFLNQKIDRFNSNYKTQIPLSSEFNINIPQKETCFSDYSFLILFLKSTKIISSKSNYLPIQILNFFLNKDNKASANEKSRLLKKLEFFNILFGNPQINLDKTIKLMRFYPDKFNINMINNEQATEQQIGLSLISYLEKIQVEQYHEGKPITYTQFILNNIQGYQMNSIEKEQCMLSFLSTKSYKTVQLPFYNNNWINQILFWKSNEQPPHQFSLEWWQKLWGLLDNIEINTSPEFAALYYFVCCKVFKPIDKIFKYINKNHDQFTFFLEFLIIRQQCNKNIHKQIMVNKISFLIDNNESQELIDLIIDQCEDMLFNQSELQHLKDLTARQYNTYFPQNEVTAKFQSQEQKLQKLVYDQEFDEMQKYFIQKNNQKLLFNYQNTLFQQIIPILIIQGEKKQLIKIIEHLNLQNINFNNRNIDILQIAKYYCGDTNIDIKILIKFNPQNVFEQKMIKQILQLLYQ